MTRRLYHLLLRLYPRNIRDEFGDEMLAVFEAAAHDSGGVSFLLRECGGILWGAARERTFAPQLGPAAAGIALAAATHWALYEWLGRTVSLVERSANRSTQQSPELEVGVLALAAFLCVVPLIVLASRNIQGEIDRRRFRPTRTHA